MPRPTRGSIYVEPAGTIGIRWPEDGQRPQKGGFKNRTQARNWFDANVAPRLRRGGPSPEVTFDSFCDLYLDRWGHDRKPKTVAAVAYWLKPARERFGAMKLAELESAVEDITDWRNRIDGSADWRHKTTRALRQVLAAGCRWGYLQRNPAVAAGSNPQPRARDIAPFSADELDRLCEELAPRDAALVMFAAETGLRTSEWTRLERRDVDRLGRVVIVRPEVAKTGKARRVPLTPRAEAALDMLPPSIPLLFTAPSGGRLDLDNWRLRVWYPALEAAGLAKRGPYSLRHTFAARALAAGVSIYELTELMGTSIRMIEATYGSLMPGSEDRLRAVLAGERHA
jgi:integrase